MPGFGQMGVGVLLTVLSLGRGLHATERKTFATEISLKNVPFKCHRYGLK